MLFPRDVMCLFLLFASNVNSVLTIVNHYLPNDDEQLENYSVKNEDLTDMQICVKTLAGKTILLEMDASDSIENVKEIVEAIEGIPMKQQILVFFGQRLEDRRTLFDYHVTNLSVIHLIQRVKGGMQIFIINLTGKRITLDVKASDSIEILKAQIEVYTEVPPYQQRLIFNGFLLEEQKTLSHYNAQNGSTIFLIRNLRGGGGSGNLHVKHATEDNGPRSALFTTQREKVILEKIPSEFVRGACMIVPSIVFVLYFAARIAHILFLNWLDSL